MLIYVTVTWQNMEIYYSSESITYICCFFLYIFISIFSFSFLVNNSRLYLPSVKSDYMYLKWRKTLNNLRSVSVFAWNLQYKHIRRKSNTSHCSPIRSMAVNILALKHVQHTNALGNLDLTYILYVAVSNYSDMWNLCRPVHTRCT